MPSRWIHERKNEHYHQKAKEEGYRSRASYKLIQIHNKFKVFDDAKYVLDLGAAPGGWLQVAAEKIEDGGLVLGVDLQKIKPLWADNVITIEGDVRDQAVQAEVMEYFDGKADVIMSDMAPDIIGQWEVDQYRQIHLARIALKIADKLLKRTGWFIVKVFQGGEHVKYVQELKDMFEYVRNYKPPASRKQSAERYIIARNLKKNRKLPREFKAEEEQEEDEGPLPGDQLFQDPGY
ncbi:MAG: RlmE family RNA methyltransferase [Candidatus Bathyarchaeota archaeon]|nr:RlmE family RNA methyltransferase [Candidatus Bathyarchaeota archaeon]